MSKLASTVILAAALLGTLQAYQSHKVVRAGKITGIGPQSEEGFSNIYIEAPGAVDTVAQCSAEWQDKHQPQVGGYLVFYADGYVSYSPAEPFETGYTPMPSTFLDRLKAEAKELEERLEKLNAFLSIPDADRKPEQTPSAEEMNMLWDQRLIMQNLLELLRNRLHLHKA
jgi:hypothetical protein